MEKLCCLKCAKPLEAPAGAGRPPRYCSATCRRAAEFELRRIQRHLERLESEAISLAGDHPIAMSDHPIAMSDHRGRTLAQQRADNRRAIELLEQRLRALIEAENGPSQGAQARF